MSEAVVGEEAKASSAKSKLPLPAKAFRKRSMDSPAEHTRSGIKRQRQQKENTPSELKEPKKALFNEQPTEMKRKVVATSRSASRATALRLPTSTLSTNKVNAARTAATSRLGVACATSTTNLANGRPRNGAPSTVTKSVAGKPVKSSDPSSALKSAALKMTAPKPANKLSAWDYKGRLGLIEDELRSLRKEKTGLADQLREQMEKYIQTELDKQTFKMEVESIAKERSQLELKDQANAEVVRSQKARILELEEANEASNQRIAKLQIDNSSLSNTLLSSSQTIAQQQADMMLKQGQIDLYQQVETTKDNEIKEMKKRVEVLEAEVSRLEDKARQDDTIRRYLHNEVQELKGNIRVFCRVRPLLASEKKDSNGSSDFFLYPDSNMDAKQIQVDKTSVNSGSSCDSRIPHLGNSRNAPSKLDFAFDKVYTPRASQADVFEDISQLVQSSVDGYNVCIFAYGQTGSGKTFTMLGNNLVARNGQAQIESDDGMISRAVEHVFSAISDLKGKGWSFKLTTWFLEIYNEIIQDLIEPRGPDVKHTIMSANAKTGDITVTNLKMTTVTTTDEVFALVKKAQKQRTVASTLCNERSSRSHLVFQLKLIGENSITGESSSGSLTLVDLAGSERIKESGSEGERLKEAKNINLSLSSLAKVITGLSSKSEHVSYRDSKLTHLLQPCLSNSAKMLMFVNISPKEDSLNETINSLRFATTVNKCNIGTSQKKIGN